MLSFIASNAVVLCDGVIIVVANINMTQLLHSFAQST